MSLLSKNYLYMYKELSESIPPLLYPDVNSEDTDYVICGGCGAIIIGKKCRYCGRPSKIRKSNSLYYPGKVVETKNKTIQIELEEEKIIDILKDHIHDYWYTAFYERNKK